MEQTINRIAHFNPDTPELYSLYGSLFNEKGQYQKAVEALTQSIQVNKNDVEAHRRLAWAYANLHQVDHAKAVFEQTLLLAPHDVTVKLNLGLFYKEQGEYKKAIEVFRHILEIVPNHKFAVQNMANCYFWLGEIDKAITYTQQAIQINPTANSYSALGAMLFSKLEYKRAADAFEHAIALNDQSYINWGNLGDAYRFAQISQSEQAYREAIKLAEHALAINPNNGLTVSAIAYYLACIGDRERAIHYARKITPEHSGAYHYYVATAYATIDYAPEAIEHLTIAVDKNFPREEILTTPILANLRKEPEFQTFLRDLEQK
ncbi:TPR repeat [Pseudoalteromonas luteoviolacea B = ATCC 29581]|nr:TPR repeat [Pseudoalteromonas luteoviolacea B = ATCC 29581]